MRTVAMDDFGTGYSASLASLQRLPIDVLKIDQSFVTGMLADRDSIAIVRAVLWLAEALGMSTTAEGIDSVDLAETLTELGCTYGQGYYFAAAAAGRRRPGLRPRPQRLSDVAARQRAHLGLVLAESPRASIRARSPASSPRPPARARGPSRSARRRRSAAAAAILMPACERRGRRPVRRCSRKRSTAARRRSRRRAPRGSPSRGSAAETSRFASRLDRRSRAATASAISRIRRQQAPRAAASARARCRRPARALISAPSRRRCRSRAGPASRCRAPIISPTVGVGSGESEQLEQLVGDPLARQRHQVVGARGAGVDPPGRARRRRSGRGSGRSAGSADGPRRCGSADRR